MIYNQKNVSFIQGHAMRCKGLSTIALVGALTGCTGINSSSFSDMSTAYRQIVENYSNENILLNIVRSSKNMPLSFLDIPSVIGTGRSPAFNSILLEIPIAAKMVE